MTLRQAEWASGHDWCLGIYSLGYGTWKVKVIEEPHEDAILWFTDYAKLREWAGY